jgi:hypothetical protein
MTEHDIQPDDESPMLYILDNISAKGSDARNEEELFR